MPHRPYIPIHPIVRKILSAHRPPHRPYPPEVEDGDSHPGEEFVEPLQLLEEDDGGRGDFQAELLTNLVVFEIRRKLLQDVSGDEKEKENVEKGQQTDRHIDRPTDGQLK